MNGESLSEDLSSAPGSSTRRGPEFSTAARILARYGGDRSSAVRTAAAVERFFSLVERRSNPLFGREGYRTLIEQAHLLAVREHPLLELWGFTSGGATFFGRPPGPAGAETSAEFWNGAVALTGHLLRLLETLARRGEMDGLEVDREGGPSVSGERSGVFPVREDAGTQRTRAREPWRILVMDRDLAVCQAIGESLDEAPDFRVVDYARTGEEVRSKLETRDVDFVVASGHLPTDELLKVCRLSHARPAGKPFSVVISGIPEDYGLILGFLEAGARAVTLEEISVQGLRLKIRLLARGEAILPRRLQHLMSLRLSELSDLLRDRGVDPRALSNLTAREMEVLDLVEAGLTNQQIARRLHLSEGTVKGYVHQILKRLNVRNRKEAASVLRMGRARQPAAFGTN